MGLSQTATPHSPDTATTMTRVTSRPRRFFVRSAAKTVPRVAITKLRSNVPQRALMPLGERRSRRQLTGGLQADPFLAVQDSPAPPLRRPLVRLCRSPLGSALAMPAGEVVPAILAISYLGEGASD